MSNDTNATTTHIMMTALLMEISIPAGTAGSAHAVQRHAGDFLPRRSFFAHSIPANSAIVAPTDRHSEHRPQRPTPIPTTIPHGLDSSRYVSTTHPRPPPTINAASSSVPIRTACPSPAYNGSCRGGHHMLTRGTLQHNVRWRTHRRARHSSKFARALSRSWPTYDPSARCGIVSVSVPRPMKPGS